MFSKTTCIALMSRVGLLVLVLALHGAQALEKRDRWSGLYKVSSSSTIGEGNLFLTLYGRSFLWDNAAAQKLPTMLPHAELGYGLVDFAHISGGFQVMTTRPSLAFLKLKVTTPNTKNIRLIGIAQSFELYRNLLKEFKSNGLRYKNEGFTPDFFLMGNEDLFTFYRLMTCLDFEMIKLFSFLPFKFYLNLGIEGGFGSWMGSKRSEAMKAYEEDRGIREGDELHIGTTNFTKVPILLGAELKTRATDFFFELEAEPFLEHVKNLYRDEASGDRYWVRYNIILEGEPPGMRIFDIHMLETPIYLNLGGRLKYPNGLSLLGGFSWSLSFDMGGKLGPCSITECREGATDGFSPFLPQWRLFSAIKLPLKFRQTSAELYRTYLLRRNQRSRKVIDIDDNLQGKNGEGAGISFDEEELKEERELQKEREKTKNRVDGKEVEID
ncbi:hypothetical protein ACFL5V_02725 [Fibrobacterota bacterium]